MRFMWYSSTKLLRPRLPVYVLLSMLIQQVNARLVGPYLRRRAYKSSTFRPMSKACPQTPTSRSALTSPCATPMVGSNDRPSRTLFTRACRFIHYILDRCSPCYPPQSLWVMATSSAACCTSACHVVYHTVHWCSPRHPRKIADVTSNIYLAPPIGLKMKLTKRDIGSEAEAVPEPVLASAR